MAPFYLDANALLRWAEGQSASPTADQLTAATRVEEIINDVNNAVVISELTFIEFHDQLLRYRASGKIEWTDAWVSSVQSHVMEWIEEGRISVQAFAPRSVDVAMSYISIAREAGRSLKAADAIHLDRAIEWAHDTDETVTVVTGDRSFSRFLDVIPAAARFITVEEIVVTQPPEPGTPTLETS